MKKFKKILSVALAVVILICINTISYNAKSKKYVYLGGEAFGVKLYTNGVVVIDVEDYYDGFRYVCPAKDAGIRKNDIIKYADNTKIYSNEDLKAAAESCNGKSIRLTIERNKKMKEINVKPIKNTVGVYLLGLWVRDSCAGIGTVTYYDADNNYFAALGHGICDTDTNQLMPLSNGVVVSANISGVTKSSIGKAGSLNGYFCDEEIGNLTKNSSIGIYGNINNKFQLNDKKYQISDNDEIKIGKAQLFTTVNNSEKCSYDIEISKICNKSSNTNENFVIKITDDYLIKKCGGIVQGMSGSPIVQNNKIIGALTHVFVNSPTEGYGIQIQNMACNYKD